MNWAAVLLHPRHAYGSSSTTLLLFIGYEYMQGVRIENRSYSIDFRNNLIVSILFKITIRHILKFLGFGFNTALFVSPY